MKIVHIASEGHPFSKTGGLADVIGALPAAQKAQGAKQVHVILPYYEKSITNPIVELPEITTTDISLDVSLGEIGNWEVSVYKSVQQVQGSKVTVYLLRCPAMFNRNGVYQENGVDYADNLMRYALFCKASLMLLNALKFYPDIIHGHDWQTGLVFALISSKHPMTEKLQKAGLVFTIHNLGYQGIFPHWEWDVLSLPRNLFHSEGLEFYGKINLLKSALVYSHMLVAASPSYALEITEPEYGHGLEGVLQKRSQYLRGVLNGIDVEYWNPETDKNLPAQYSVGDLQGKAICKAELIKTCGLKADKDTPILGFVGRLASQKGIDILMKALPVWFKGGGNFVVLGSGDMSIENELRAMQSTYHQHMYVTTGFNEWLAHLIEAGSDFFAMPSRYEPCGLNQMISMRYGTVPIVRSTGGLADTVVDYNPDCSKGNGITFDAFDYHELETALKKALSLYSSKECFLKVQQTGMNKDYSWGPRAKEYLNIYEEVIRKNSEQDTL